MLAMALALWGCGGGAGLAPAGPAGTGASVVVVASASGDYVIEGHNMDGVAAIELVLSYDSSALSAPTVTQGGLVAGALMVSNTTVPGTVRVAIITTRPFSGSGPIAVVSFAAKSAKDGVAVTRVEMSDINGKPVR